uniref:SPARC (osteonectin), cwcv and kazal like domains proteoglycan 2 n=1 Tax=Amazona collaria TaxID=241587 RepID=A0A8B9G7E6_9PSIT
MGHRGLSASHHGWGNTFCLHPPGFSLPAGSITGAGACWEAAAGAGALPSCSLNGTLCRVSWWPLLLGSPEGSPPAPASFCPAALDTTKDPCQKVKCSRHKVCVAQGYQRAMCISRKKLEHRMAAPHPAGMPGQQAADRADLADLGDRLRDWFQLLRENAKQNGSALERSVAASCKEAVGWMFARLDTSGDLFLEAAELAAINLDKYEVCIRAFFNSCDTSKDGRVSAPEWCFCFWRESPPCLRELEKIQIQEAAKKKQGTFIPSCDEDGYYQRAQCEPGGGECWCVDQHGVELTGTRSHGSPDCGECTERKRGHPELPSFPDSGPQPISLPNHDPYSILLLTQIIPYMTTPI